MEMLAAEIVEHSGLESPLNLMKPNPSLVLSDGFERVLNPDTVRAELIDPSPPKRKGLLID